MKIRKLTKFICKNIIYLLVLIIIIYLLKNSKIYERFQDSSLNKIDISLDKFKQRFIIKKHFTPDICNWIIQESENYAKSNNGWTNKRHEHYPTTDIPIHLIPSIYSFLKVSFKERIYKDICKCYSLEENYKYEVLDCFIVKYEAINQKSLEPHKDAGCISINILLNDPKEFIGGGTYFEDDITVQLKQGDMLIHCSKTEHSGLEITEGKRYVLVFFIDLFK
jgi:hypothetical protein